MCTCRWNMCSDPKICNAHIHNTTIQSKAIPIHSLEACPQIWWRCDSKVSAHWLHSQWVASKRRRGEIKITRNWKMLFDKTIQSTLWPKDADANVDRSPRSCWEWLYSQEDLFCLNSKIDKQCTQKVNKRTFSVVDIQLMKINQPKH